MECKDLRQEYLRLRYTSPGSVRCQEARRSYKACLRRTKRAAQQAAADQLKDMLKRNPLQFWRCIKGRPHRKEVRGTVHGWHEYMQGFLGTTEPATTAQHGRWRVPNVPASNDLNEPFTEAEMDAVLDQLKRNKAADTHGLRAELLKDCIVVDAEGVPYRMLAAPLLHLCNLYLTNGAVAPEVAKAWVQPVPKPGADSRCRC